MSATESIRRNEYLFRSLFEEAPLGIAVEDLDGQILLANPALCTMLGYSRKELQRMTCAECANPEDSKDDWALFQKLRAGLIDRYSLEKRYVRKDGTAIWGRLNVSLFKRDNGESPRVLALLEEITAHKQAEEARSRHTAIVESSDDSIISVRLDGIITDWNTGAVRLYGHSKAEAVGQPMTIIIPPELQDENVRILQRLAAGERVEHRETVRLAKDGRRIDVSLTLSPVRNSAGKVVGVSGVARDITERIRSDKALRESEEKFRRVFRDAGVGMLVASPDGRLLAANSAFCEFLGYSENELLGKTIQSITHPADWPVFLQRLETALTDGGSFQGVEKRCLHKSGRILTAETSASLIRDADGKPLYFVGEALDITERKKAEEGLRQSEKELLEAQRVAEVGSWKCDPHSDTVTWSRELYRIAGRAPSLPPPNFTGHPQLFTAESWERLRRPVEEALRSGTPYELEVEMVRPDGTTRWVMARGEAQRDSAGHTILLRGTAQDITERKRAEKELADLSGHFVKAQEEERSRLARELHDDVSQRLALVVITLDRLRQNLTGSASEIGTSLDDLFERMNEISSDIHRLSHQLHPSTLALGLVPALRSLSSGIERQHGMKVTINCTNVPDSISTDVSLCLYRVAQEALSNVIKHSGVKQARMELLRVSGRLSLRIIDTGRGFQPRAENQSGGLGLLSMRERLRLVGGSLTLHSQPSQGTEVIIEVPVGQDVLKFPAVAGG